MTSTLKRKCAAIKEWTLTDEQHASGEFTVNLFEQSKERHFAVARERMREGKAAVDWLEGASSKLIPPEDRLAIGGGTI